MRRRRGGESSRRACGCPFGGRAGDGANREMRVTQGDEMRAN